MRRTDTISARYAVELDAAIEAARDAGALLRAELARGPRGEGGFAPADGEAEARIAGRLLPAFPEYGARMEERAEHTRVARDGAHHWLVDPNDGTRRFLRGERGTAVSIALVRDGAPVLGVVFAFAAPDDAGDLFAWAEGGSLTRNGAEVARAPWPESLGAGDVVLVTQSASARAAYEAVAAPARAVPVPSLAYRLARVAAGDAAATYSLRAPKGWDYAAGDALLRGAGGALVDGEGAAVRYEFGRDPAVSACFGGGAALVASLVRRARALELEMR